MKNFSSHLTKVVQENGERDYLIYYNRKGDRSIIVQRCFLIPNSRKWSFLGTRSPILPQEKQSAFY